MSIVDRRYIFISNRYEAMKNLLLLIPFLSLIILIVVADPAASMQIESDIPAVPVYFDGVYAGKTPLLIEDIVPGWHQISGSPDGLLPQTRNISVESGVNISVNFTFHISDQINSPPQIRIGECIGTPEISMLDVTAYDLIHLSDGTLIAYYTGWNDRVSCMVSPDGVVWTPVTDPCLDSSITGSGVQTEPWVFAVPEGGYRMIFRQSVGSEQKYILVSSSDGYHFTKPEPVTFSNINSSEKLKEKVSVPSVILYPGGFMRVYYHIPGLGIMSANSTDYGKTWSTEGGSRIRDGTDPSVVLLPDGKTGMFYVDLTPKSKGQRIFFSISDNGLDFSSNKSVIVLDTTEPGIWLMDPEVEEHSGVAHIFFSIMGGDEMQNHHPPHIMRSVVKLDCLAEKFENI